MLEVARCRIAAPLRLLLVTLLPFSAILPQDSDSPAEALHAAVRTGHIEQVRQILDNGVDVNARDRLGSTPLLDAVWNGNIAITTLLLSKGADVNAMHAEAGSTALEYAVLTSHADLVSLLIAAHADLAHTYRSGQGIMHIAAGRGDVTVLKMLAAAGASIQSLDANSNSPLDEAVLHDRAQAVQFLIAKGLSANDRNSVDGRGPLHEACVKGYADLIPILLHAGADPDSKEKSGQSPLDLALAYKNVNAVKALLDSDRHAGPELASAAAAMENATMRGQVEVVRLLLSSGLDINRPAPGGTTYLHDASLKGQVRVVALLLDAGAKLEARNQSGGTALHDAALGGNIRP